MLLHTHRYTQLYMYVCVLYDFLFFLHFINTFLYTRYAYYYILYMYVRVLYLWDRQIETAASSVYIHMFMLYILDLY